MFNNNKIKISAYGVSSGKVKDNLTIAHLSDLHEKEFGALNEILIKKVEGIGPDIIAVTGDIVAHEKQKYIRDNYSYTLSKGLSGIAPSFFVTGNHERNFDEDVCEAFEKGGTTVIKGEVYTMNIRGVRVNISGMDDVSYGADAEKHMNVFLGMEGFNLFLTHRPEIFELAADKNIDLILAGHTHAGQIRIPIINRIYMNGQGLFPKYMQGEFCLNGTTMIISRGLGASGYPAFRINNPPELVEVCVNPYSAI